MSDFASNCPISRPIKVDWKAGWDLGGMSWSYQYGMFYQPAGDNLVPIRPPSPRGSM